MINGYNMHIFFLICCRVDIMSLLILNKAKNFFPNCNFICKKVDFVFSFCNDVYQVHAYNLLLANDYEKYINI